MFASVPMTHAPPAPRPEPLPTPTIQPTPIVRAQAPEEPDPVRPPLLAMPSPEQFGIRIRPVENRADWTVLLARFEDLAVVSFFVESLPDGRARFTCWLPLGQAGLTRRIEAVAATKIEAAQLALQQAARERAELH